MAICEFCIEMRPDGRCNYGLSDPKGMSCKYFNTNIGKFCANPDDFVDAEQIVAIADFFRFKKSALKKVTLMAKRETAIRASAPPGTSSMEKWDASVGRLEIISRPSDARDDSLRRGLQ